ncbi:MAG: glycosyltransferase [Firmicutes bacterium]|nr:glycosyltransferase [Bacillota bacterium]
MRILAVHNYYQLQGGEDVLFVEETALLESKGHSVKNFTRHNNEINTMARLPLVSSTIWNRASYKYIKRLIKEWRPDVIYFYNTFPLFSPSVYYAAREMKVPVVQVVQNYRLLCPGAFFFRGGHVCEDCLGKVVPWPGLLRGCYRQSRISTAVVTAMLTAHRMLGTWEKVVDVFIVPTAFARKKLIDGGLPPGKIIIKPNFIRVETDPGHGRGGFALFVGRLSPEKGINTMLSAWKIMDSGIPLKIVGEGPLESCVTKAAQESPEIDFLGFRSLHEIFALMGDAKVLIFPSEWYEGLPRTIIESFAKGTPVIASCLGAMESIIEHGRTGLHYSPGNPEELAAVVKWAFNNENNIAEMRKEARAEFDDKYTAENNYQELISILHSVIH